MADVDTFQSARREIGRGSLAQVYYLTGSEELLKDELVRMIVEHALDPSTRDFNVDVRLAADVDGETLHALVETPPMLAERRVVVVKYVDQWRKNAKVWTVLERYLEHPSPTTTLVVTEAPKDRWKNPVADGLRRHASTVACDALGSEDLRLWVQERATQRDVELETDALDHLIAATQGDLGTLTSEIEKLGAAAQGTLTVDEVSSFVGVRKGETAEDWLRAVLLRDTSRAVDMLDRVLALPNSNGVRLVNKLGAHLLGLRRAVSLGRRRNARGQLERQFRAAKLWWIGTPDQAVPLWLEAAGQWSIPEIDRAVRAAYDADRSLKSTRTSTDAGVLTDLVLVCAQRERAA